MSESFSDEDYKKVIQNIREIGKNREYEVDGSHRITNKSSEYVERELAELIQSEKTNDTKFSESEENKILSILKEIQKIQKSSFNNKEKISRIRYELWSKHNSKTKLLIGAFLGTLSGLAIFGTGGIGIAALGSATGFSGFLTGTAGGVFISSLIQNFEKNKD